MNRLKAQELSLERIYTALSRRLNDIPDGIAWKGMSKIAQTNREHLATFAGKHKNQRCFIIGNGPSLSEMDLSPLKNEITFGLNRIYLLFEKIPFVPTYFVCVNELVLDQFAPDIRALPITKFLNWNRRNLFNFTDQTTHFLKISLPLIDKFSKDITKPISGGGTVTYVAMQIAYFMGFEEVVLIGVDHNFLDKGTPNKAVVRIESHDQNHFDPNYFPQGSKWQLPDLKRSELAYTLARQAFDTENRSIVDATINGKCMVFKKVNYSELF